MKDKIEALGKNIPSHCRFWRFQGDHNMIGCQITGALCHGESCDPNKVDPTGYLRERLKPPDRSLAVSLCLWR